MNRSDGTHQEISSRNRKYQVVSVLQVSNMSSILLSFCIVLVAPLCKGQGSDCSCNVTNSRCDESGVCRCDPGWEGERCERCVPTPGCRHGSCQQPWQCRCEAGWGGRFCDKDLSLCSARPPCQNGATCVMEDSAGYTCLCPGGFYGRNCQLKTGPCTQRRSPCKNGGLCEDADGFAVDLACRCLAGFTGRRCETDVDDCLMRPCANGATCLDGVNRFSCLCPAGFSGRFCTVNLDDCASRPCLNAGRCLDRAGGFHCICRPGYAGATCETEARSREPGRTAVPGWEGDGGAGRTRPSATINERSGAGTSGGNGSRDGGGPFKVTVSERRTTGLSEVHLIVLVVLAGATLAVVALTATLVLQGYCMACGHTPCWPLTSSSQHGGRRAPQDDLGGQIGFLYGAEPEKKKLNTEVT
ncbi:protein delta homolog 2 [Pseudoliparis swirei]|uniref:protein delta homolog 2 n=1 Tax=Pseudoliparis swirei TaxID=2059687 RepID=UPI0024BE1647|nr:protein delta homolog 2 [Pseudoliparis swirei]